MRSASTGVVVVSYGPPDDTLECLDSLERSRDLDLEIVVVDNGPADSADHHRLRDGIHGRATLIATGDNLGYAGGNNVGIRHLLEGDVERVWLLNPDTRVGPRTLGRLRAHLDAVPDCAVVGPRLVLPAHPPEIWYDGGTVDRATGDTAHPGSGRAEETAPPGPPRDTDYVSGASFLVRRSALEHVGLLPEDYFLYFEETAWCLAAADLGWRVMVAPRARMLHLKRSGPGRMVTPYYAYYVTRNRYHFAQQVLGIDAEQSLERFERHHVAAWRSRVAERAPHWLEDLDELVARAKRDARAGVTGRAEGVSEHRFPEEAIA